MSESSSYGYGSIPNREREQRRPPRPSSNTTNNGAGLGSVNVNSSRPPKGTFSSNGSGNGVTPMNMTAASNYASSSSSLLLVGNNNNNNNNNNHMSSAGTGDGIRSRSRPRPVPVPKMKISAGKHRIDSWSGLGAATRNAIFENLGDNFDLGALAGAGVGAGGHPLQQQRMRRSIPVPSSSPSVDIGNESSAALHPFLLDQNSTSADATRRPIPRSYMKPQRSGTTHLTPSQAAMDQPLQQERSPERSSYQVNGRLSIGGLFTINSMGESFYNKNLGEESESPLKIQSQRLNRKQLHWLQRLQKWMFGRKQSKGSDKVKQKPSNLPLEVDAFSKFARGEDDHFELTSKIMESDDEDSVDFACTCFDPNEYVTEDRSKSNSYRILCAIHKFYVQFLYNSECPEFTSQQQSTWAVLMGIFFGVFTALWGKIIEKFVETVWITFPAWLLSKGVFTNLDGHLPLPHYMWITPTIFGGILGAVTAILPVPMPGQDQWIESLHKYGVMHYDAFAYVFVVSTLGMASGMSLGPETPLVLLSGMIGSFLAIQTQQSILAARVLNLTAASAGIGGFFGFPMAGALFVLEVPHRLGLQYYEALSPSIIASIVAVLVNRMVTGNEVKGYYNYPFLSSSLPSHVFYIAVLYGLLGAGVGILYCRGCFKLKHDIHDLFHEHNDTHNNDDSNGHSNIEKAPLVGKMNETNPTAKLPPNDCLRFLNKREWRRCMAVGSLAGFSTGIICMFLPHLLFWGEAQLQSIIDRGHTELPFITEESVKDMTAYGFCMIDRENENFDQPHFAGYSTMCNGSFALFKIAVVGISLGSGIVGGQFWGPLYTGAAASYFLTDIFKIIHNHTGIEIFGVVSQYPCVALLCIMGATHVVTFRAHTAIMLILTLTVSSFDGGDVDFTGGTLGGGDYSAVFPLLVVACFISLMCTRDEQFYIKQQNRGDIIASPEVLCEPMKHGSVVFPGQYLPSGFDAEEMDVDISSDFDSESSSDEFAPLKNTPRSIPSPFQQRKLSPLNLPSPTSDNNSNYPAVDLSPQTQRKASFGSATGSSDTQPASVIRPRHRRIHSDGSYLQPNNRPYLTRSNSQDGRGNAEFFDFSKGSSEDKAHMVSNTGVNIGLRERARSREMFRPQTPELSTKMMKVTTYGELQLQPDLMDQARARSATSRHSGQQRKHSSSSKSNSRQTSFSKGQMQQITGALNREDIEKAFSATQERLRVGSPKQGPR